MNRSYTKVKKYTGGRTVEIHDGANPDNAMKKLQRWMKEENMFIEMRERDQYISKSEANRKSKHLAIQRQNKKWRDLEDGGPPLKQKSTRNKSNRGKKTNSRQVKKPNSI